MTFLQLANVPSLRYLQNFDESFIGDSRAAAGGIFTMRGSSYVAALSWIPFVSQESLKVYKSPVIGSNESRFLFSFSVLIALPL